MISFAEAMLAADPGLLNWARKDPTLISIRSHTFNDIIKDAEQSRGAIEAIRDAYG